MVKMITPGQMEFKKMRQAFTPWSRVGSICDAHSSAAKPMADQPPGVELMP